MWTRLSGVLCALAMLAALAGCASSQPAPTGVADEDRPPIVVWGGSVNFQLLKLEDGKTVEWEKGPTGMLDQPNGKSVTAYEVTVVKRDASGPGSGQGQTTCGPLTGPSVTIHYTGAPAGTIKLDRERRPGNPNDEPKVTPVGQSLELKSSTHLVARPSSGFKQLTQVDVAGSKPCRVEADEEVRITSIYPPEKESRGSTAAR